MKTVVQTLATEVPAAPASVQEQTIPEKNMPSAVEESHELDLPFPDNISDLASLAADIALPDLDNALG